MRGMVDPSSVAKAQISLGDLAFEVQKDKGDNVLRAKSAGKRGFFGKASAPSVCLVAKRTYLAFVVAVYEEGTVKGDEAEAAVTELANYLISVNY